MPLQKSHYRYEKFVSKEQSHMSYYKISTMFSIKEASLIIVDRRMHTFSL